MAAKFRKNPHRRPGQGTLFPPASSWVPPSMSDLPDFKGKAKLIGVDTETNDPNLNTLGPGFIRNDAEVCGISLAAEDGTKIYLPINHQGGGNVDPVQAVRYAREQLSGPQPKCGANLHYDMEALWSLDIPLLGPLADVQICEPLIDEDKKGGYSLNQLSKDYLGVEKTEDLLRDAAFEFGVHPKKGMWQLPSKYVGPYAEDDAYLPILIYQQQLKTLEAEDLMRVFDLERRLQKTLFKMRLRGVKIDLDRAQELSEKVILDEKELLRKIKWITGEEVNPWASDHVAHILKTKHGLVAPRTAGTKTKPNGNPSISNDWLEDQGTEICDLLLTYRKTNKMRKDFIDGAILERHINGRLHPQWHQLREDKDADEGGGGRGTRTGRIAASKPNLTQVPSRDPKWGPAIRSLFIAETGQYWCKCDYSQQEPRITLHFAYVTNLPGSAEARQRYINDPGTDYHQMTADMILDKSSKDIGRRPAKDINLGRTYGMGKKKLIRKLKVSVREANAILKAYDQGVPFVKPLSKNMGDAAQERGYIRTLLGRRKRFKDWEPENWDLRTRPQPSAEAAREEAWRHAQEFGIFVYDKDTIPVVRAMTHKALNASVQGSAADQMKTSLVQLDEAGLLPLLQVYDEANFSIESPKVAATIVDIMENSVPISVPHKIDPDIGPSWGQLKEYDHVGNRFL